jgi:hypothetical protein
MKGRTRAERLKRHWAAALSTFLFLPRVAVGLAIDEDFFVGDDLRHLGSEDEFCRRFAGPARGREGPGAQMECKGLIQRPRGLPQSGHRARRRQAASDWRLGHREEGVDEFGGEGFQFGGALGAGFKFFFFADEPMAVGLDGAGAEATTDQVGRLAVQREAFGSGRGKQRTAVPFPDADVAFVHRKGDDLEAAALQAGENLDLLRRELHTGIG